MAPRCAVSVAVEEPVLALRDVLLYQEVALLMSIGARENIRKPVERIDDERFCCRLEPSCLCFYDDRQGHRLQDFARLDARLRKQHARGRNAQLVA